MSQIRVARDDELPRLQEIERAAGAASIPGAAPRVVMRRARS